MKSSLVSLVLLIILPACIDAQKSSRQISQDTSELRVPQRYKKSKPKKPEGSKKRKVSKNKNYPKKTTSSSTPKTNTSKPPTDVPGTIPSTPTASTSPTQSSVNVQFFIGTGGTEKGNVALACDRAKQRSQDGAKKLCNASTSTQACNCRRISSKKYNCTAKTIISCSTTTVSSSPLPPDTSQRTPSQNNSSWWKPKAGISWAIQYEGRFEEKGFEVHNIDLVESKQSDIDALRAKGKKVMCYFSAGTYESWRPDKSKFNSSILGKPLDDWPGERWIDIRSAKVKQIMIARLDLAKRKRCDGVDPDNVDGFANNNGFGLSSYDQKTYLIWLANEAHRRGLGIGLKNNLDQVSSLAKYFDWAVNEQCMQYRECGVLEKGFTNNNKPVFHIEYNSKYLNCGSSRSMNFSSLRKNLNLTAWHLTCF